MTLDDAIALDLLLSEVTDRKRIVNKSIQNQEDHDKIAHYARFLETNGLIKVHSTHYPDIVFSVSDSGISFKSTSGFELRFQEQLKAEERAKLQEEANRTQIEANKISVKAYRMSKIAIGISIISVIVSVLIAKIF